MHKTMQINFYWKGMKDDMTKYCKTCHKCQKAKKTNKLKHRLVQEKEGVITKWSRVIVDLWGRKLVVNKTATGTKYM